MEQRIWFVSIAEFRVPGPMFMGSHRDTILGTVAAIGVTTWLFMIHSNYPRSSQALHRTNRWVQQGRDRFYSAPFKSLIVALNFVISPRGVICFAPPTIMALTARVGETTCGFWLLPIIQSNYSNYTFKTWGNDHRMGQLTQWTHCELNLGLDFCLLTIENPHFNW